MLHQVGVSFDLYYDARKHKIKLRLLPSVEKQLFLPRLLPFWRWNYFFLILAHPVYKM